MTTKLDILRFLHAAAMRGQDRALIVLTDVVHRGTRDPGTLMAIAIDGSSCGTLSNGCVEAAIIGEAIRVMASGRAELLRLGAGSRLIDIRLPCGGGMDLLILPNPSVSAVDHAVSELLARRGVGLRASLEGALTATELTTRAPGWHSGDFQVDVLPDLRLVIVGTGLETTSLARLSNAYGAYTTVLSPDREAIEAAMELGSTVAWLKTPDRSQLLRADKQTAVIFLFHDHDWERALIQKALEEPAFFVGAMGSRITHARRVEILLEHGVAASDVQRLVGPIGLIGGARDPDTLALSVLSQVVAAYHLSNRRDGDQESRVTALPTGDEA